MKIHFTFLPLLIVLFLSIHAHAKSPMWTNAIGYDRMTGEIEITVQGKMISPETSIPRPHHNLQASFVYQCNEGWEGLFIGFNKNLRFGKMQRDEDGYLWTEMRINFDRDQFTELLLTGKPSATAAFYNDSQKFIHKVAHSSSALVEVFIQGIRRPAYFNFDLEDAKSFITKAQKACGLRELE